jgi:O-antigen biosynthesis protein WbqP
MAENFMSVIILILKIVLCIGIVLGVLGLINKPFSIYAFDKAQRNPLEGQAVVFIEDNSDGANADGVCGHLEIAGREAGVARHKESFYEVVVKRLIDIVLSLGGLIVLSPVYLFVSIWILIDDPGPILFTQKRLGKNKRYFKLHKFRSMKMSTPHDRPTHMLENPEQYITRAGRFIRAHSLDELPQIWDIFIGNMSVVGPRPGLWNQDVLTAERDKYGANDVKPGLTGWAQINGRDELELSEKARLDGEYVSKLGFAMDVKCFFGSVGVFTGDDSVVEGGTGRMGRK